MDIGQKIKEWINKELHIGSDFSVEHPKEIEYGDYSTNIALIEAKKTAKNPKEMAQEFVSRLQKTKLPEIEKIEVAGVGFINFFLKKEFFAETITDAIKQGEKFGENKDLAGQKIIIEYTVTNVLKPMHIGHLMGNVIGESLSRIIESEGALVKRNNYQGDSGLHIAKAVWGIKKLGGKIEGSLSEKSNYIGSAYEIGSTQYDIPETKKEIDDINKKVFEKSDPDLNELYEWGKQVSLNHFEELYKKLGTTFDFYFFESEVTDAGLQIVREFLKKGLFKESEGAVVFHGEKYDSKLHTRVFISSQGLPMYEAKDLAHALRKYEAYKFDTSIIVTANEQNEYFKVMLRALQEINPDIASKTKHISHGLLKLSTGKMGSRKGNAIFGEALINDVQELVLEKMVDREMSKEEKEKTAEIVAIGAIKYSILRQAIGGDIIFDFEKSLSFEGDSGPYLQYAYVRAQSVLAKVKSQKSKVKSEIPDGWQTTHLEKMIARFPEVVERSGKEYAPHYIVTYLTELASSFNNFYAEHKISDENDPTSPYRLAITESFSIIMKKGLDLLGIKVPESM